MNAYAYSAARIFSTAWERRRIFGVVIWVQIKSFKLEKIVI